MCYYRAMAVGTKENEIAMPCHIMCTCSRQAHVDNDNKPSPGSWQWWDGTILLAFPPVISSPVLFLFLFYFSIL